MKTSKESFTLIELLVRTSISPMRFFKCGDKQEVQNTSLFLKKGEGLGEGKNLFSREKKFFPSPIKPFTLIELLVVITIFAILAAILLPALQSARARGRQTSCVNNLKQCGSAYIQYYADYDDFFPMPTYKNGGYSWWAYQINPYLTRDLRYGIQRVNATEALLCPSNDGRYGTSGSSGTRYKVNYAQSVYMGDKSFSTAAVLKTKEVINASQRAIVADANAWHKTNRPYGTQCRIVINSLTANNGYKSNGEAAPGTFHNGGTVLCFVDGHVDHQKGYDSRIFNPTWNGQ